MNRLLIIFCFLIFSSLTKHKYYVSTSLFNFTEDNSLQVTLRIFKDDLSNAISKNYLSESSDDLDLIDKFYFNKLEDYFNLNLNVLIENKKIKLNLLGLETKNDMYVCFLEIENLESFTTLSLENKILFEIFKDQQNIIHVKKNSKKRSFISRINNSVLSVNI
jgi:hypothetical protein